MDPIHANLASGLIAATPSVASRLITLNGQQSTLLWAQLGVLLLAARLLGTLARRLGLSGVVGELMAGLILGPSVLGNVFPAGFDRLLPSHALVSSAMLAGISTISLGFLLLAIGFEADLGLIGKLGRAATSVTLGSMIVPVGIAYVVAALLPKALYGAHAGPAGYLFVALAVGISSLPVIAKIVSELGMTRRDFGQLLLASGSANDAVGFLVLALAMAMATSSGSGGGAFWNLAEPVLGLLGLGALFIFGGQRLVDLLLRRARQADPKAAGPDSSSSLAACVVLGFLAAAAAQALGIEGALGTFVAGIALGRSRFREAGTLARVEAMSSAVFAPLYFATAGLRVDVATFARGPLLVAFVVIVVIALVSKFAGSYLGAIVGGLGWRQATALGIGLNGRGALQVVIASAALSVGALSTAGYSLMLLMAIVTSLLVPSGLRRVATGWAGTEQERKRLRHEGQLETNVAVKGERMLLPSLGHANSIVAAEMLDLAWPEELGVTVLAVAAEGDKGPGLRPVESVLGGRELEVKKVRGPRVLEEILAEARLGYGVIAVGAADNPTSGHLLSPVVDDLLTKSPIPLLVARRPRQAGDGLPAAFARAIVPVSGAPESRAGQEVAFRLSARIGTELELLHIVTRPAGSSSTRDVGQVASHVLSEAKRLAGELGVNAETKIIQGRSPGEEIVAAAEAEHVDLVILGASARVVEGKPFLGHTVEHVLTHSPTTVVVAVLPSPQVVAAVRHGPGSAVAQSGSLEAAARGSEASQEAS